MVGVGGGVGVGGRCMFCLNKSVTSEAPVFLCMP